MSLRLAMIVRDEENTIERALESAKPLIDSWCIVDTGSSDRTREVIAESMNEIPGELLERPWQNFGRNRTELLALAGSGAEWLLLLDADWTIAGEVPDLEADSNWLRFSGDLDYRLPLIVRADLPWLYIGQVHEYLDCSGRTEAMLDSPQITDHADGGTREQKLERDRVLLEAAHAADPDDPRTVFYLARTYNDLGMIDLAIAHFRLRAEMGGFEEERVHARYSLGCLLCEHVSFDEGAEELLKAWRERPSRIEPLRALSNSAWAVADKAPYPSDDRLFILPSAYKPDPLRRGRRAAT